MSRVTVVMAILAMGSFIGGCDGGGGASKKHRVVFECTAEAPEQWQGMLNTAENVRKALGEDTQVMVVVHGKAGGLVMASNTEMAERIRRIADSGVTFAVCQNTLRRMNVTKEGLFPFVVVVDSGVAEIVRRQEQGWAYVKAGH